MPEYFGSIYQKKGGDEALQKRYARLQEIAREDGILGPEQEGLIPDEVKNAFSRLADIISRPNYAIAGAFDTLAGTGKKGESVPNRVLRELFSGVGGLQGDKEFFGEVLEQKGVGEGGRLSDIVGEDSILTLRGRFDPTLRGTAGLALDILTDPLTWIGAPAKGAGLVISSTGGKVRAVSKAGRQAQLAAYDARVLKRAEKIIPADELAKLKKADNYWEIENRVVSKEAADAAYTAAGLEAASQLGEQQVRLRIMREAGGDVADRILAGERVLEEARGLRFRPPVPGVDIPLGFDRALSAGARRAKGILDDALNSTQRGKILVDRFSELDTHLKQLFTRVNPLAKKLKAYEIIEAERFAMFQSADHLARMDVVHVFGSEKLANKVSEKGWKLLTKAIDNPDVYRQAWLDHATTALKLAPEDAAGIIERWNALTGTMGKKEIGIKLLETGQVAPFIGRYITHMRKRKLPGNIESELKGMARKFRGPELGSFADQRVFKTLDEYEKFLRDKGLDPDLYIEYNPLKLMTARMGAHYKAMVNEQFLLDAVRMYAPGNNDGLHILREALKDATVKPSPKERKVIDDLMSRMSTFDEGALANQVARGKAIFAGTAEAKTIATLEKDAADLIKRLESLGVQKSDLQKVWKFTRFQQASRRGRIADLIEDRAAVLARATEARGIRGSLRERIKKLKGSAFSPETQKVIAELEELKKSLKLSKAAERELGSLNLGPLEARYLEQKRLVDSLVEEAKGLRIAASKSRIDRINQQLADLDNVRAGISSDIEHLRAVNKEIKRDAKFVIAQVEGLARAVAAGRRDRSAINKVIQGLEKQAKLSLGIEKKTKKQFRKVAKSADIETMKGLPSGVKAGLMYEMLGRTRTLKQLENTLNKYGDVFDSIHVDSVRKARDATRGLNIGELTYAGQAYKSIPFEKGALKGQTWSLPEGIKADFDNFSGQWESNPEVKSWLRLFDRLTNTFKLSVTSLFPAFNTRNAYSNVSASAMDIGLQALNPRGHAQILNILRGADGTLTTYNGKKIPYSAIRSELDTMGIRIDRLKLAEMTGEATAIPGVNIALTSRKSPLRFAQEGASLIENEARALHYVALRRRGYAAGDAATQVNKFLFDYSNLSPFEQNVMRRIIPFYTWQRKNIERQIKNLYEHPGRVAARAKIFAGDRGPENEMLPDYLRGNMLVTLTPPSGKSKSLLTGIDLPVRNVDVLWAGGFGQTLRENLNMVNPLLKAPLEIALNMDSFTNRSIRGQQWMGRMGPSLDKLPKWMKEYINLNEVKTQDGRTLYRADGLKFYLITKGLFLSRFLSTGIDINEFARSFKGDEGANLATLTKIMSGLNLREFDLTEEQEAILRNNMNRLQDALLESGGAREITVPARRKKKEAPSFLRVPTL